MILKKENRIKVQATNKMNLTIEKQPRTEINTTIVIPNYKGIKFIENCLSSIYQESRKNCHVILVDNCSHDGSLELVRKFFPEVEIIECKQNYGFCKAVNIGIKASKTEYVLLLNNDTEVELGFVQAMESAMASSIRIFSVSAKMVTMDNPDIMDGAGDYYCALGWAFARGKGKEANKYTKRKQIFASCGGAAIYRKNIFDEIGYFDEKHFAYLEDVDIGYRAMIYGYTNWYEPKAVVKHEGSGVSGSRYNEFKIMLSSQNSIYVIYKNMPLLQILLNSPFFLIGFLAKTIFFWKKGYRKIYIKGLFTGFRLCLSEEGKANKVRFKKKHLVNYMGIQVELWLNILRKLGRN